MLRLEHYDDGKQKHQSHEIRIRDGKFAPSIELDIFSYNPLDITGYGSTKEEALDDFKRKFDFLMKEWQSFKKMLFEADVIENDILEVDCLGNSLNYKVIKIG